MSGNKLNWDRARKEDLVRAKGYSSVAEKIEMPAPAFWAEQQAFNCRQKLKADSRRELQELRRTIGGTRDTDFEKLLPRLDRLVRSLESDQRMLQESIRLEAKAFTSEVREHIRWRRKKPERRDPVKLYHDSVAYIEGAGSDFPRVISCANAVETLAYLHRWKHWFPAFPLNANQVEVIRQYVSKFAEVRMLAVRFK